MSAPDDMITVTLRRDEWGRISQAMRQFKRKAHRDISREGFDPALAPGAIARKDAAETIHRKLRKQLGEADD